MRGSECANEFLDLRSSKSLRAAAPRGSGSPSGRGAADVKLFFSKGLRGQVGLVGLPVAASILRPYVFMVMEFQR